jgi:hypothetical protein
MESINRDVKSMKSDETSRRAALGRAVEIARQGRAAVESQGITAEEADAAIDEAIREVRRSKASRQNKLTTLSGNTDSH